MDPVTLFAGIGSAVSGMMGTATATAATMGQAAIGASAMGSAMSAVGAGISGLSSAAMLSYQAGIAKTNASIARQNAAYSLVKGEQAAAQSGMKSRAAIGQTEAAQGASGLMVGAGTNADVVSSEKTIGGLEQTTIRAGAAKTAYDYDVAAASYDAQAKADSFGSTMTLAATPFMMGSSILGGATSVSSKWYGLSQSGAIS